MDISGQYGRASLTNQVAAALRAAGLDAPSLPWERLAPLDQFHVGGMAATTRLAQQLSLGPRSAVVDLGCGPGGPSRHLASVYGCTVIGVDLHEPFIELATMLNARTGLADRVRTVRADATSLPFTAASFDIVWTQHAAMNVADRVALYRGAARVLTPNGLLAIHDVLAGDGRPLDFPLPWARDPALSFLVDEAEQRRLLREAGFEVVWWEDATDAGLRWIEERVTGARATGSRPNSDAPPLALSLVAGSDLPQLIANLGRNLRDGRARLVQLVASRAPRLPVPRSAL